MIETILLIVITLITFGNANGEYPSKELLNAHNLISCVEKDTDAMNSFHLAMQKVQGTTKSKSEYHNLLTFIFAGEDDSEVLKGIFTESGYSNIEQVIWMCRKAMDKR